MFKIIVSACLVFSIGLDAHAIEHGSNGAPVPNMSVETALRPLISSREQAVAVAAMFSYSRLGYRPDTISLLQETVMRGAFDNRTYLGELAHLFDSSPADKQLFIISEIDRGDGEYARQILAAAPVNSTRPLCTGTRRALHDMLSRHEPGFSTALGEFGMFDAFTYANWLHTVACLQAGCATAAYDAIIMERLNANHSPAKKILAYLASDNGVPFLNRMGKRPTAAMVQKVKAYAHALPLPPNPTVLEWAGKIQRQHMALKN